MQEFSTAELHGDAPQIRAPSRPSSIISKSDRQDISERPIGHFFRQRALKRVFRVLRPPDETPSANGHFDARRYSFHNCDCYLLRLTWCGGAMSQCRAPKQLVR